jgi:protein-tyrosine kinase
MNSLIEQAARRLEQLRQAGATMPEVNGVGLPVVAPAAPVPTPSPPPVAVPPARTVHLDLARLARAGYLTPLAPRSLVADQFRVVKRPLIGNAVGKQARDVVRGNLIMVTSAMPGEGKTFTAINLALSLATELDTTVLLVDADVTRPSIMDVLGQPRSAGLMDLLQSSSVRLGDTLLRTNIDKLTLLPSGTPQARATEMLASEAMAELLQEMASRYANRIIVFDSPPLLLATESRVLATHMGQVVVVVQAEETRQSDVHAALATIDSCPLRLLLLNQARNAAATGYDYGPAAA